MDAYAENRRAHFDYTITETLEAGIELKGFEVKAVKSGRANLAGSFAVPRAKPNHSTSSGSTGVELWLLNADIPPYQPNNTPTGYDSKRSRRLLVKAEEIKTILGKKKSEGLTLVPLKMYNKRGLVKVLLGFAKPKKTHDRRESIKKREVKREIERTLKQ